MKTAETFQINLSPERQDSSKRPVGERLIGISNGNFHKATSAKQMSGKNTIFVKNGGGWYNNFDEIITGNQGETVPYDNAVIETHIFQNQKPLSTELIQGMIADQNSFSFCPETWSDEMLEIITKISYFDGVVVGCNGCLSTTGEFAHWQYFTPTNESKRENFEALSRDSEYQIDQTTAIKIHQLCWQMGINSYLSAKNGNFCVSLYLPENTLESCFVAFEDTDKQTQLKYLYDATVSCGILENTANIRIDKTIAFRDVFMPVAKEYEEKYGICISGYLNSPEAGFSSQVATQLKQNQVQRFLEIIESINTQKHITDSRVKLERLRNSQSKDTSQEDKDQNKNFDDLHIIGSCDLPVQI